MPEIAGADETLELLCDEELKIVQKKEGYRFSVDAILLANFIHLKKGERLLDIGTGCGIIPIYMMRKGFCNNMTGIELQPGLFQTAVKNKAINGCENIEFIEGDATSPQIDLKKARFDVAVSNPPYTRKGTGRRSPDDSRHIARHEEHLDLSRLLSLTSSLLHGKGRLYLIYPSTRIGEVMGCARAHRMEPKRLRFIHSREAEESILFLAEFLKDGGAGTVVEKPLYIYKETDYTEEVRSYYTFKGQETWKAS
ncbi:MAG TPA: methyltransferase domain-containing protein [Syntrophorhabdaceae bacterium]|jgi:tRNA1Val (adenine37-N6)-methyltransferase